MTKLEKDILNILAEDSRTAHKDIAVMLGVTEADIAAAVKSFEAQGIIVKYSTVINQEKLDRDTVGALIEVKVSPQHTRGFDAIAEEIYQFEEVKSLYLMSGGYDLTVIVEGRTLKEVAMFVSEKLSCLDKVIGTATHFILKKYKESGVMLSEGDCDGKRLAVHV